MTTRTPLPAGLIATGVVAVLRAPDIDAYLPVVETLVEAGLTCIELTLTTPGTLEQLPRLLERLPETAEVGIGSIRSVEQATRALDAGAEFLVTPSVNPAVVAEAVARSIPVFPGAMTPTEVLTNWDAGATAVKAFPAATVGSDFVRHVHGPFPEIPIVPSGGIGLDEIGSWLIAGAVAVSLGGPLIGNAFDGGDLGDLRRRTVTALDAVTAARG